MKRLIALFIVCLILTACFIPSATAAEATNGEAIAPVGTAASGTCGENASWSLSGTTLTITGSGDMYDYDYSDNRAPWYNQRNDVETIVVEEGLTSIGQYAFFSLKYVDSLSLPGTLTDIDDFAFYMCEGITSVTIPSLVKRIGESAFSWCKALKTVKMSDAVEIIGDQTFAFCSALTSINLSASLKSIGHGAFGQDSELSSITLPSGLERLGHGAFVLCSKLTSIVIPEGITEIEDKTFMYCSGLKTVVIPDSVKKIGEQAFYSCRSLTSLRLMNDVEIGRDAFADCGKLVIDYIMITSNIKDVEVEHAGDIATLSIQAVGEGLTYTWYYKNPSWKKWSKSDQSSPTYSIRVTKDRDGRQMYCVVTDKNGRTLTSDTVTLTYKK